MKKTNSLEPAKWLEMMTSKFKRYPGFKDMQDELREEIKGYAQRYGRGKVEAGIEACMSDPSREGADFMPAPGVLHFYVIKAKDPDSPKLKAPDGTCDKCHGDGFYRVQLSGGDLERAVVLYGKELASKQYRMSPCECRRVG